MFALKPGVNWAQLREQYRPRALAARSTSEFAGICADMLERLRDLHVWLTVSGESVPVFNRFRADNANPAARRVLFVNYHPLIRGGWAKNRRPYRLSRH